MYHPRLYGDFYSMGFKYGALLHKNGFKLPEISAEKSRFGLASYEELKSFYPEVVDEIKGFASGIEEKEEKLAAFLLSISVLESAGQCSLFAYRTPERVIFGRNYDCLFQFLKFTESSLVAPEGKYAYISQSDVFIGRSDGINEKGLAIGISFVRGSQVQPGINFYFLVRYVLENCSSTREAVEVLKRVKVASANNFLIADRSGALAVVESCPQGVQLRMPAAQEAFIFCTNQFVTAKMAAYDQGGVEWSRSSERYQALARYLGSAADMDVARAKEILSDKASCLCLHLKEEKFGTLWSVVADLKSLEIARAEGQPKVTNYKEEGRLDWWLKKRGSLQERGV